MKNYKNGAGWAGVIFAICLVGVLISAWVTHVIVCINAENWIFLIAGAVAFPVGWIHGIGYWFGFF